MSFRRGARQEPTRRAADADPDGSPADPLQASGTRRSAIHAAWVGGLVFVALLLVFIIQNLHSVSVHFFTARFRLPVGVVLVLAAVIGGVIVSGASFARVAQLRRRERRRRKSKPSRGS